MRRRALGGFAVRQDFLFFLDGGARRVFRLLRWPGFQGVSSNHPSFRLAPGFGTGTGDDGDAEGVGVLVSGGRNRAGPALGAWR